MKRLKLLFLFPIFFLFSCGKLTFYTDQVVIIQNPDLPTTLEVFSELPDLTKYIKISVLDEEIEVSDDLIIYNNIDMNVIGKYTVKYAYVYDGKTYQKNLLFKILDTTKPEIKQINMDTNLVDASLPDFTKYIEVIDNYDGKIALNESSYSITNYLPYQDSSFIVTYQVSDSSGNKNTYSIPFNITYPNGYYISENFNGIEKVDSDAIKSSGDVKVLVIPIDFNSSPSTDLDDQVIKKSFFDKKSDNYLSLYEYYYRSSYFKLELTGEVLSWQRAKFEPSYYENYKNAQTGLKGDAILIQEAVEGLNKKSLNLDDYDKDNNGYIDAVYFLYNHDYNKDSNIYWAYKYWYYGDLSLGNKKIGSYVFASVNFLEDDIKIGYSRTLIHETGHLLGLDDYYDYNIGVGPEGGLGKADMMDYNAGDHNPFSKLLLNWVKPIVVARNVASKQGFELEIKSFSEYNTDNVVIIPAGNNSDLLFNEFFIIIYYTPTNLNSTQYYLRDSGILIYHVISYIGEGGSGGKYRSSFQFDNSDTDYKLIRIYEADQNDSIETTGSISKDDLLVRNQSVKLISYTGKIIAQVENKSSIFNRDNAKIKITIY